MKSVTRAMRVYEVRPRKDKRDSRSNFRCFALRSAVIGWAQMRIANAIGYAKHRSRSHPAVIRVYDEAGDVIEMREEVSSDSPTEELLCKNEAISALPVTDSTKPQVLAFYSGGVRWI